MGITIHFRFARREEPEELLKELEKIPLMNNPMSKISQRSRNKMWIEHEGCETICLHWHKWKTIKARKEEWDYEREVMKKLEGELDEGVWVCAGFVKTQYAGPKVHALVSEILRKVAGRCYFSIVSDEADYYEKFLSDETLNNLMENFGKSQAFINKVGEMLKGQLGEKNVKMGVEIAKGI